MIANLMQKYKILCLLLYAALFLMLPLKVFAMDDVDEPGALVISKYVSDADTSAYQSSVGMVYYERYEEDGVFSIGIDGFLPVYVGGGGELYVMRSIPSVWTLMTVSFVRTVMPMCS